MAYYYGQKHELFHAIFAHWRGTIDARMEQLRQAQASPRTAATAAHRRGLCHPVLAMRASSEGEYYARNWWHANSPTAPRYRARAGRLRFDPGPCLHRRALHAARPGTACAGRLGLPVRHGALLHHLIDHRVERLARCQHPHDPQASLLIDFMAAGISALLPIHPSPEGVFHAPPFIPDRCRRRCPVLRRHRRQPRPQQTLRLTAAGGTLRCSVGQADRRIFIPEVDKRLADAGSKTKIDWTRAWGGTLIKIGSESGGIADGVLISASSAPCSRRCAFRCRT